MKKTKIKKIKNIQWKISIPMSFQCQQEGIWEGFIRFKSIIDSMDQLECKFMAKVTNMSIGSEQSGDIHAGKVFFVLSFSSNNYSFTSFFFFFVGITQNFFFDILFWAMQNFFFIKKKKLSVGESFHTLRSLTNPTNSVKNNKNKPNIVFKCFFFCSAYCE